MTYKDELKLQWWKLACEKNPDPVAFISLDDQFIFCNKAWCKLFGYSESELRQKTWKDITKIQDIGSNESEIESVKIGKKDDYYLEKTYIRKDNTEVLIKIYVHKYPEMGALEGLVVFAKRVTSEDYEDLKSKFLDLHKTVLILQQNAIATDLINNQISIMDQKLEQNKELMKLAIQRGNINIGDKFGDNSNKAGRDNIINSGNSWLIILFVILFCLFTTGSAVLFTYLFMSH